MEILKEVIQPSYGQVHDRKYLNK